MSNRKEKAKRQKQRVPPPGLGRGHVLMGLVAAALGVVLYVNTLGHGWVLDDYVTIKANWIVKSGITAESLKLMFTNEYRFGGWNSPGSLYRPIPLVMFAGEWQAVGDDPRLGHFMNMLLYGLTGWMLWTTLRRILRDHPPALAAAATLLFMAHPIHTEVVANIKSRDEILSLLFALGALRCVWNYLDTERGKWLGWAMAMYTLALFSKESAVTMVAVIPLSIWFFHDVPRARIIRISVLMLIPALFYLAVRQAVLDNQPYTYKEAYSVLDTVYAGTKDRMEQLATAFMMSMKYLRTLVIPHSLVSDMGYPQVKPVGWNDPRAWVGLAVLGSLFGLALAGLRRKWLLSFAILFFLITFSLFSNIFMIIGTSYGERLMYVPSLGLALALGYGLSQLAGTGDSTQWPKMQGRGLGYWVALGGILIVYAALTIQRNPAWASSESLYRADLITSPDCAKLNYHNGLEQFRLGFDKDRGVVRDSAAIYKAIEIHTHALELFPKYPEAHASRGACFLQLGKHDNALIDLEKSLFMRPNNAEAQSNLGFILVQRGQLAEAEQKFRLALKYEPRFVDGYRNLGSVMAMQGRFAEAIPVWKEGLKYDADSGVMMFFIGSAYKDLGKESESIPWMQKAKAKGHPM